MMKQLIIRLLSFSFIFICLNFILVIIIALVITTNTTIFQFDQSKRILILGSSYTGTALNDSIVPNAVNMSQGAEAYFYTYLKLRLFIEKNPQINTVILNYANLSRFNDYYYEKDEFVVGMFVKFFYLMEKTEMNELFLANPQAVLRGLFTIPIRYVEIFLKKGQSTLSYKNLDIGGYIVSEQHNVQKDRKIVFERLNIDDSIKFEFSEIQKKYLLESYNFCRTNNVELILFTAPVDSILFNHIEKIKPFYYDLAKKDLNEAKILDYSSFYLPDSCFFNCDHLNSMGAKIISMDLINKLDM